MGTDKFNNQKYFLFKIQDVLNNAFHSFENKRLESISLCLQLCVETAQDISKSYNSEFLINAYKSLLESLDVLFKYHPFEKLDEFRLDFEYIQEKIKKYIKDSNDKVNARKLDNAITGLFKRFQAESLIRYYVDIMNTEKRIAYQKIDNLISFLVSDLLYIGYSMQHLQEWYKNEITTAEFYALQQEGKDLSEYVKKFLQLSGDKKEYTIYIKYTGGAPEQKEKADNVIRSEFEFITDEKKEEKDNKWFKDEKFTTVVLKTYKACDVYKAIRLAQKQFESIIELYHMSTSAQNNIINSHPQYLYELEDGNTGVMDIRKKADIQLIDFMDRGQKQQYEVFLGLLGNEKDDDFETLDRVMHTLYNARSYNVQNRFLNFWSSMEYLVYPFPRKSIIEKSRIIVPQLISMFYIKDKINIFWERFIYNFNKKKKGNAEYPILNEFYTTCTCKESEVEYETKEVITFLMNKDKSDQFIQEYKDHVVIVREFQELYMLINDAKKRKEALQVFQEIIICDLNIIYRMRNQLIHSTGSIDDSLEYIGLRLYKYVNAILSTILYYKHRNYNISICEILHSIEETYEYYIKDKKNKGSCEVKDLYRVVRPKYMYIE